VARATAPSTTSKAPAISSSAPPSSRLPLAMIAATAALRNRPMTVIALGERLVLATTRPIPLKRLRKRSAKRVLTTSALQKHGRQLSGRAPRHLARQPALVDIEDAARDNGPAVLLHAAEALGNHRAA